MTIQKFEDEEAWMNARRGTIGGTRAGNLMLKSGTGYKMGFYELIAELVALPPSDENVMDRGKRLEQEGIEKFTAKTGIKMNTDLVIICRDDDERINYSPDGYKGKRIDAEVKCLSSARHIEAWLTKEVPSDYVDQIIQGFVVNDSLRTRYMIFFDPRMPIDIFWLEVKREDYKMQIVERLKMEREVLKAADEITNKLTFE